MKLYKHELENTGVQRMYGFPMYIDNQGVSEQFPYVNSYTTAKKCNSCRNLQMSNVFDTKSQHAFLYGVPQGIGALSDILEGLFDHF